MCAISEILMQRKLLSDDTRASSRSGFERDTRSKAARIEIEHKITSTSAMMLARRLFGFRQPLGWPPQTASREDFDSLPAAYVRTDSFAYTPRRKSKNSDAGVEDADLQISTHYKAGVSPGRISYQTFVETITINSTSTASSFDADLEFAATSAVSRQLTAERFSRRLSWLIPVLLVTMLAIFGLLAILYLAFNDPGRLCDVKERFGVTTSVCHRNTHEVPNRKGWSSLPSLGT